MKDREYPGSSRQQLEFLVELETQLLWLRAICGLNPVVEPGWEQLFDIF
jgi:hypothetical protein